jgi:hypothetical protein
MLLLTRTATAPRAIPTGRPRWRASTTSERPLSISATLSSRFSARADDIDILAGLQLMAPEVRRRTIPDPTECPAPIEVPELLPPSWALRLSLRA